MALCGLAAALTGIFGLVGDHANAVVAENRRPGDDGWQTTELRAALQQAASSDGPVPPTHLDEHRSPADSGGVPYPGETNGAPQIVGYAGAQSVNRGGPITFHVSSPSSRIDIRVFRMGWYAGAGGREMTAALNLPAASRPVPLPDANGTVLPNWPATYTLQTGTTWTSGVYLATLSSAGATPSSYIPFVVRNDASTSPIVYSVPFSTYQAYNDWGGKSLYDYNSPGGHAVKVSFDRPYKAWDGAGLFFDGDYYSIRFLEREGADVTYVASDDIDRSPNLMTGRRAFLSTFHDEYWSARMRTNLEGWVNSGVHAAFLGANSIYWQVRFEPSSDGRANRIMVSYKDRPDPVVGANSTVRFRDPPVSRPENALLGSMYEGDFAYGASVPWVVTNANHWIYQGTGLANGAQIPKLVGYEWDRIWDNGVSPSGVIALSDSTPRAGARQQATIHQKPSGAIVFNASTIYWPWLLDNGSWGVDSRVQQMTRNLLNAIVGTAPPPPTTIAPTTIAPTTVTPTTTAPPPSATLVASWNFENATTQGWGPWFGGSAVTVTNTLPRTGGQALRVTPGPEASAVNSLTLTPGQRYDFQSFVRPDTVVPMAAVVQFYNALGQPSGTSSDMAFAPDANGWYRVTASFVVPAGTTRVYFGINVLQTAWRMDDVTLTSPAITSTTTTTSATTSSAPAATTTTRPATTTSPVGTTTTTVGTTTTSAPATTTTRPVTTTAATTTTAPAPTTTVIPTTTTTTTTPAGPAAATWNFEDGTVQGWTPWFGGSSVGVTNTGARTGASALRVLPGPEATAVNSAVLTPGQQYQLNGYIRPDVFAPMAGLVQFYDALAQPSGPQVDVTFVLDVNGWYRATASFTVPPNTTRTYFGINALATPWLLDDVTITVAVPVPTTTTTTTTTTVAATTTTIAANATPTVSVSTDRTSYRSPATVSMTATATDADGSVVSVQFLVDGSAVRTDSSAPFSATVNLTARRTYTVTARATDNRGATTNSGPVLISVR